MSEPKRLKPATRLVHEGRRSDWTRGIVNTPVHRASTCLFDTWEAFRTAVTEGPDRDGLYYGRHGTPSQWSLRQALTDLEGAHDTVLYPSGKAAVCCAILSFVRPGDHVLMTDSAYEPTRDFAKGYLKRMGVETTFYDPRLGSDIADLMQDNTRVILVEAPGSLTFEVQDIPAIAKVAHAHDAFVLMDNTWATALLYPAFDRGVDVSIQALTKYVVGHSDVMLGSATANERAWRRLNLGAKHLGLAVSPDDAFLALRGLRTLSVRLREHEAGALKVARWLEAHPKVERVLHPGLESHPDHALWKRDFMGSSGLFSFILSSGDYADMGRLVDAMELFKLGFSWGGFESLILPSDPDRVRDVTPLKAPGPLIRLHIGLEDTADLIAELEAGLERW